MQESKRGLHGSTIGPLSSGSTLHLLRRQGARPSDAAVALAMGVIGTRLSCATNGHSGPCGFRTFVAALEVTYRQPSAWQMATKSQ